MHSLAIFAKGHRLIITLSHIGHILMLQSYVPYGSTMPFCRESGYGNPTPGNAYAVIKRGEIHHESLQKIDHNRSSGRQHLIQGQYAVASAATHTVTPNETMWIIFRTRSKLDAAHQSEPSSG